jgi:hypothetical protein
MNVGGGVVKGAAPFFFNPCLHHLSLYGGFFTASLSKGNDEKLSLELANCAAALSTTKEGVQNSMPTFDEIIEAYNEFAK